MWERTSHLVVNERMTTVAEYESKIDERLSHLFPNPDCDCHGHRDNGLAGYGDNTILIAFRWLVLGRAARHNGPIPPATHTSHPVIHDQSASQTHIDAKLGRDLDDMIAAILHRG